MCFFQRSADEVNLTIIDQYFTSEVTPLHEAAVNGNVSTISKLLTCKILYSFT